VQIVVNHLTRMTHPRICVAGVSRETGAHVRPTTPRSDPITRDLLREEGGPFAIGAVVDLGRVTPRGHPPEVEDHVYATVRARLVGDLDGDEYIEVLERASTQDLAQAFGPALNAMPNDKYAVEIGEGAASLAVLKLRGTPRVHVNSFGRLRLRLSDPDDAADLSVADIRFYERDHATIRRDVVADVSHRLARRVDCYVMVGLSRPFEGGADHEVHWAQANGLCLVDRPTGDTP
jgi:hypothetical protein